MRCFYTKAYPKWRARFVAQVIVVQCLFMLITDAIAAPSAQDIETLVTHSFGSEVTLPNDHSAQSPRYLRVAVTSLPPNEQVLVVALHVDAAKGALNQRAIKLIATANGEASVDDAIGKNCLGLAFFHGVAPSAAATRAAHSVYFLYECFSGYTRVAQTAPMLKRARVNAEGEAILLDLESGGQLLVYWREGQYRTKLVRLGD